MNVHVEPLPFVSLERRFAYFALFLCLPIIFAKIVSGNTTLSNATSEMVGGKENVWLALERLFILAWRFSWFLTCVAIGAIFTWLSYSIVYLDSRVPGMYPPSPFAPGRNNRFSDGPDTPRGSPRSTDTNNANSQDIGADGRIAASSATSAWVERFSEPAVDTSSNGAAVAKSLPHKIYFQKPELESLANNEGLLIVRENKPSLHEDRFDVVGKLVAIKLRNLPTHQMLIAERIINDALFEAEMGNLTLAHKLIAEEISQKCEEHLDNS